MYSDKSSMLYIIIYSIHPNFITELDKLFSHLHVIN